MKSFILYRGFKTKAEILFGNKDNSALLIQTLADKKTKEQNRLQVRNLLEEHKMLSEHNFLVACSDTVFIAPTAEKNLYVAGNPHIACGFFDRALNLYPGAFQSKGFRGSINVGADIEYNGYQLIKQSFRLASHYHTESIITNHFFQTANNITTSTSPYSNGKEENSIVNTGGSFYLLAFKHQPCFLDFKMRVAIYNQTSVYYDRLNDSCAHAVLECLDIYIPNRYALDTQTALALIIMHSSLSKPKVLTDCLKDSVTLGLFESTRLKRKGSIDIEDVANYIKSHFHCKC